MATTTSPSNGASLPAFDLDPIDGQAWCERVTREEIEAYGESIKNSDDANAATAFAKAATSLAAQHEGVADIAALAAECERLASAKTRAPLIVTSPAKLVGTPPARRWIVRDCIPCGVVTGLYGDGGIGKSLLAQQ